MLAPTVSVVIPLFNKEGSVEQCINSVLNQSFQDFEIIVINDGSTDNSLEIVKSIIDSRINIFSQPNAGVSAARNYGIEKSSCDLIAFLDADDIWMPFFLDTVLSLFRDFPDAKWAATGYQLQQAGKGQHKNIINGLPISFSRGLIDHYFRICANSDPLVHSSSVCIHRKAIEKITGFPIGIYSGEDLLTWAKLAISFPLAYDIKPASSFYVSGINRKPDLNLAVAQELKYILKANPKTKGLKEYLGLWFRMQAIAALKNDDSIIARRMSVQSLYYHPIGFKNLYIAAITYLPISIGSSLDSLLRNWMRHLRQ